MHPHYEKLYIRFLMLALIKFLYSNNQVHFKNISSKEYRTNNIQHKHLMTRIEPSLKQPLELQVVISETTVSIKKFNCL